jgi:hypothetical protein
LKHDDCLTGVAVLVEITVPTINPDYALQIPKKEIASPGENFPHQIPKGSITCADKQHLQPVKERPGLSGSTFTVHG